MAGNPMAAAAMPSGTVTSDQLQSFLKSEGYGTATGGTSKAFQDDPNLGAHMSQFGPGAPNTPTGYATPGGNGSMQPVHPATPHFNNMMNAMSSGKGMSK